ncbi:MAG: porphobilinogen synthase [Candidatus Omnitrophica bacterium]|nr:porphobilinogen synthase [Candidatus Omnitrophota bacterium]
MQYPVYRSRRLRSNDALRLLVRETRPEASKLVMPFFVLPGKKIKKPVGSMPGIYQFSVDILAGEVSKVRALGIPAVLLFGLPAEKDEKASQAYKKDGIVQQAVRRIKEEVGNIAVITDVCLCSYTKSGHCGILKSSKAGFKKNQRFYVDNDATLEVLERIALSHALAGADCVAPSAMMDGQVGALRFALDREGFENLPIMAYSAKFASSFYSPFRDAASCAPQFGDRKSYQMCEANASEALRETRLDIEEGADIVMVKPALAYLDIIQRIKANFDIPVAAYNVSGEYAMLKAAAEKNLIDERNAVLEIITGMRRAGADIIITYYAKEIARWLKEEKEC